MRTLWKTFWKTVAICLITGSIDGLMFGAYYLVWGDHRGLGPPGAIFLVAGGCLVLGAVVFGIPLFLFQLCWCRMSGRLARMGLGLAVSGMLPVIAWRLMAPRLFSVLDCILDPVTGLIFLQAAAVLMPAPFLRGRPWVVGAASAIVGLLFCGLAFVAWQHLGTRSLSDYFLFCPLGAMILATAVGAAVASERSGQRTKEPSVAQDSDLESHGCDIHV
jgi:hypothetical protein